MRRWLKRRRSFLDTGHGLEGVSEWGTFVVDGKTLATCRPEVFAGGDAYRGPGILIEAIADGRRGALSIDRHLRGVDLLTPREETPLPVVELGEQEIAGIVASGKVDLSPREVERRFRFRSGFVIFERWSWRLRRRRRGGRRRGAWSAGYVRSVIYAWGRARQERSIINRGFGRRRSRSGR